MEHGKVKKDRVKSDIKWSIQELEVAVTRVGSLFKICRPKADRRFKYFNDLSFIAIVLILKSPTKIELPPIEAQEASRSSSCLQSLQKPCEHKLH